ncbi:MAG: hypothetical protein EOP60_10445 [Sphingomonadales bacterium]|nr:MAG: hypothetical protein EOP60_10445 [Sphingomonadales bacterium]
MLFAIALLTLTAMEPQALATSNDVANAAATCMIAAGKKGVDRSLFKAPEWAADGVGSAGFHHSVHPVTIEIPRDKDGVARICVVRAQLPSQAEQKALAANLKNLLQAKPVDQGASLVWLVNTKTGLRGIQLYLDKTSDQPSVRLIGAAF